MTYLQAIVIGLLQGVTELFPVSSLGHSVLIPALIGGGWTHLVTDVSSAESPYLAFIVGLHVATALALLVFYRRDWPVSSQPSSPRSVPAGPRPPRNDSPGSSCWPPSRSAWPA